MDGGKATKIDSQQLSAFCFSVFFCVSVVFQLGSYSYVPRGFVVSGCVLEAALHLRALRVGGVGLCVVAAAP